MKKSFMYLIIFFLVIAVLLFLAIILIISLPLIAIGIFIYQLFNKGQFPNFEKKEIKPGTNRTRTFFKKLDLSKIGL